VNLLQILFAVLSESNAPLIGQQDCRHSTIIQLLDRFRHARQQLKLLPVSDVLTFGQLSIHDSVPVEKDKFDSGQLPPDFHVFSIANITVAGTPNEFIARSACRWKASNYGITRTL
jgi:hypothetical protein